MQSSPCVPKLKEVISRRKTSKILASREHRECKIFIWGTSLSISDSFLICRSEHEGKSIVSLRIWWVRVCSRLPSQPSALLFLPYDVGEGTVDNTCVEQREA